MSGGENGGPLEAAASFDYESKRWGAAPLRARPRFMNGVKLRHLLEDRPPASGSADALHADRHRHPVDGEGPAWRAHPDLLGGALRSAGRVVRPARAEAPLELPRPSAGARRRVLLVAGPARTGQWLGGGHGRRAAG